MRKKPFFITFEGTDGVGKSTQAKHLRNFLQKKGHKVLLTREPGGGPFSEKIRKILLDPKTKIQDLTELFLYQSARIEHVDNKIRPALRKNITVLCDRFTDATIAYQGFGRNIPLKQIHQLNAIATQGLKPDLTFLLELPPQEGLKKAQARRRKGEKGDRLENEGILFQKKVYKGYQAQAKLEPRRIKRISVKPTPRETQQEIQRWVLKKIKS